MPAKISLETVRRRRPALGSAPAQWAAWAGLVLCTASLLVAQTPPVVESYSRNAGLLFSDPGVGTRTAYRIEWSSNLQTWHRSWQSLSRVVSDGSPTAVDVPMFYRVVRLGDAGPMPTAVTDHDYRDQGRPDPEKVELGKQLFWDKILSGNRNISCATCHHPMAALGDGLSLPLGEGATGLGVLRTTPALGEAGAVTKRVARNAPALFNIGATEYTVMFHDGRVREDELPGQFLTPAGDNLPEGLENVIAAQAMFPVTDATEMAGHAGENLIANLAGTGDRPAAWRALANRLKVQPDYVDQFVRVFPDVASASDITFVHAANAIAAFEMTAGRFDNSPFDAYLRGESDALNGPARRGMDLFYGRAGCVRCHSGKFQTDHGFHGIAMPQIGPGKGDGDSGRTDYGLGRVTHYWDDLYKFRTPSLRNIALTGPWGHTGAYDSLEAVVRHHLDPLESLTVYDPSQARLPSRPDLDAIDFAIANEIQLQNGIIAANEISPLTLDDDEVHALMAFLHALTDPATLDLRHLVPTRVPSGLPLVD